VAEIVKYTGLDCVQLHGDETPEYVEKLKELLGRITEKRIEIWKAVRVKNKESLKLFLSLMWMLFFWMLMLREAMEEPGCV